MTEDERCIYCGGKIENTNERYTIPIKNESLEKVQCCSSQCYERTKKFSQEETNSRNKFYILMGVCVLLDIIIVTFVADKYLVYIPLGLMGLTLYFCPYVFVRYRSYQRLGIFRTINLIKCIGLGISLSAIFFFVYSFK